MLLKGMTKGIESNIFLHCLRGLEASLHSFFASEVVYLMCVCVECLKMINPMTVGFVLLEFDATLGDGCGI